MTKNQSWTAEERLQVLEACLLHANLPKPNWAGLCRQLSLRLRRTPQNLHACLYNFDLVRTIREARPLVERLVVAVKLEVPITLSEVQQWFLEAEVFLHHDNNVWAATKLARFLHIYQPRRGRRKKLPGEPKQARPEVLTVEEMRLHAEGVATQNLLRAEADEDIIKWHRVLTHIQGGPKALALLKETECRAEKFVVNLYS